MDKSLECTLHTDRVKGRRRRCSWWQPAYHLFITLLVHTHTDTHTLMLKYTNTNDAPSTLLFPLYYSCQSSKSQCDTPTGSMCFFCLCILSGDIRLYYSHILLSVNHTAQQRKTKVGFRSTLQKQLWRNSLNQE